MTPIEKLIKAVGIHLSYNGACEDSVGDDCMCHNTDCTYCNLQRFLTEYESAPKEGCDTCWSKQDEDVGFPEECASCCHFYASHWEAK